ncbi:RimK family alpha-L-glutamate ligase [Azoarcus olearius]|uniref:Ribosomal protein S6 modification protein-related protein n=1 Tax=Azoarcus sp. (strain BH72) TaxID=418699 RepID=A1K6A7_AZOSB|nr:RimK family alpha-L-glutamate ligase [Azoarcus olearius]ANQ84933.1 ribosomal protein S6 modification protein-like protein [Azoarcus olearius]CAL94362.1 ribosomal protein S6 modification protein-related protein [Azoarcus olearius]
MTTLIVVDDPGDWPPGGGSINVVPARSYLTDPAFAEERPARVFNLCRSYRYQSLGYYVSLLAEARGHKPWPRAGTIEDLQSQNLVQVLTARLNQLVEQTLAPLKADRFELSVYFGRNLAQRYNVLADQLFQLLQAPLLRVRFERAGGHWHTRSIRLVGIGELSETHRNFVYEAAATHFAARARLADRRPQEEYALAILHNPEGRNLPSNPAALAKFAETGAALGMRVEFITPGDFGRLPEFDALFIRDTTFVHHYTYRFARRAQGEGLVVIDDPDSILKCNNKVYLAEMLAHHNLPAPRTLLIHRDNIDQVAPLLALPCVLKQPDSSFSSGVDKVETEAELREKVGALLDKSDLIVAQEWLPTEFDWRVGVLDRRVVFVCKYYMAKDHWQIMNHSAAPEHREGRTEALAVGEAPEDVVELALTAANLIGDGFYGVDIKQIGNRCCIIEINDNPNVDAGNEDGVLRDALYREVMGVFLRRLERRREGGDA